MGNNQAFTAFEATVMAIYNKDRLDIELLSEIMEQYRDMDIDRGGKVGLIAKDGLEIEEIVIKIFNGVIPIKPKIPDNYREWTEEHNKLWDAYSDILYSSFYKITDNFGWC